MQFALNSQSINAKVMQFSLEFQSKIRVLLLMKMFETPYSFNAFSMHKIEKFLSFSMLFQ